MPTAFVNSAVNTLRTWQFRRERSGKPVDLWAEANRRWPKQDTYVLTEIVRRTQQPLYSTDKHRPLKGTPLWR